MMKHLTNCKFAHSETCSSLKIKGNILLSGGEDNIINAFDVSQNTLTMDNVLATINSGQAVSQIDFFDNELEYAQVVTTVFTYMIMNMQTGAKSFEFDAKNEAINTEYILDAFYSNETKEIDVVCGNNFGGIVALTLNVEGNTVNSKTVSYSTVKSEFNQTFNSSEKINDNCFVVVSDNGYIYLLEKTKINKSLFMDEDLSLLVEENEIKKEKIETKQKINKKNKNIGFSPY